jgi:prepilin peptidase CpaA
MLTPEQPEIFPAACVLVTVIVGAVWDLATRRIPNALTFGSAGCALVFAAWHGGPTELLWSGAGYLSGLALFLPLFILGGMGAGDVKLLAAVGAWLGPRGAFWVALWTSVAGGGLALVVAARYKYFGNAVRNVARMVGAGWMTGLSRSPDLALADAAAPRLAYAVAIAVGACMTLWGGLTP